MGMENEESNSSDGALTEDIKKMLHELNLPAGKEIKVHATSPPSKISSTAKKEEKKISKVSNDKTNKNAKRGQKTQGQKTPNSRESKNAKLNIEDEPEEELQVATQQPGRMEMLIDEELWYEKLEGLGKLGNATSKHKPSHKILEEKKDIAIKKLENEMRSYEQRVQTMERKDPDYAWISKVIRNGTLTDKIAAMSLKISQSPVHNLDTLDNLLSMVQKKGRREAKIAMESMKDLYINNLLPDSRHLVQFEERPLTKPKVTPNHMVLWYFEDELKSRYLRFVQALQTWTYDNLDHIKRAAIKSVYSLLEAKPEQESFLLMVLVNKLGDTDKKIASQVVYLLQQLVRSHPNMRQVIAKEVEQFLFQQKLGSRGIYYGVIFLNQIVLERNGDEELARKLIDIYIQLFKKVLETDRKSESSKKGGDRKRKKKGNGNSKVDQEPTSEVAKMRLLSALLTGVNRAFPYANSTGDELEEQIDFLFKVAHTGTFSTSTQALMLLLHIMKSKNNLSDRFYRALYTKLLSPDLVSSSKQTLFLNLLYRAMKADVILDRSRAFAKRLLQVACMSSAQFAAGVLFLLSSVIQTKPELVEMFKREGDEEEMAKYYSTISNIAVDNEQDSDVDTDDGESDEKNDDLDGKPKPQLNIIGIDADEQDKIDSPRRSEGDENTGKAEPCYDPTKRDPLHANTGKGSLAWEFEFLSRHYHPSVRQFVEKMVKSKTCKIEYEGDPLRDFSNSAFLDKFVYRNPRKKDIENIKSRSAFGLEGRVGRQGRAATSQAVNSPAFLLQKPEKVSSDQKFFYQFFHQKAKLAGKSLIDEMKLAKERAKRAKQRANDPFAEYESDEEEEAFAQKLAEKLLRDSGGGGDFDVDPDVDFDYSSEESDVDEAGSEKEVETEKDEDEVVFGGDEEDSGDDSDSSMDEIGQVLDSESGSDAEESDIAKNKIGNKGLRKGSPFADMESFADMINKGDGSNPKQLAWENRHSNKRKFNSGIGHRKAREKGKRKSKTRRR